jgi:alkylmercury lyase
MTENTPWTSLATAESALSLVPPAIQLLARGEPVPLARLASAAGRPLDEVDEVLHGMPRVDFDDDGNLLGLGLSLVPTAHRVRIDGRELFTWCATDAVMLPVLLGVPVIVESTCPATNTPIHLTVTPAGVDAAAPAETVVSEVAPTADCTDIRTSCCDQGHFFAGPAAAETWRRAHPEGHVRPVAEAFEISRARTQELGWARP